MARIRTIKPEFWGDEKTASLPRDARLLYVGLWNFSDDYGVVKGNSRWLRSMIFPYDDITLETFETWLEEIIKKRFVTPFEANGEKYLNINKFKDHQIINRPSEVRNPEPPKGGLTEGSRRAHGGLTEGSHQEGRGEEGKGEEGKGEEGSVDGDGTDLYLVTKATVDLNLVLAERSTAKPFLTKELLAEELDACFADARTRGINTRSDLMAFWNGWLKNIKPRPLNHSRQESRRELKGGELTRRRAEAAKAVLKAEGREDA